MRSRFRTALFGVLLGLSVVIGTAGPAWAQEQQSPLPTMPMGVSSITVEGNLIRIVGLDANGREQVILLDMRSLNTTQLQALGLAPCLDPITAPCVAGNQALGPGTAGSQTSNVAIGTVPGGPSEPGSVVGGGPVAGGPGPGGPGTTPGPDDGDSIVGVEVSVGTTGSTGSGGSVIDVTGSAATTGAANGGSTGSVIDVNGNVVSENSGKRLSHVTVMSDLIAEA